MEGERERKTEKEKEKVGRESTSGSELILLSHAIHVHIHILCVCVCVQVSGGCRTQNLRCVHSIFSECLHAPCAYGCYKYNCGIFQPRTLLLQVFSQGTNTTKIQS